MYMATVNVNVLQKIKLFTSMGILVDTTRKRFSEWGVVVEWSGYWWMLQGVVVVVTRQPAVESCASQLHTGRSQSSAVRAV